MNWETRTICSITIELYARMKDNDEMTVIGLGLGKWDTAC